jgi:hypothetical protein
MWSARAGGRAEQVKINKTKKGKKDFLEQYFS